MSSGAFTLMLLIIYLLTRKDEESWVKFERLRHKDIYGPPGFNINSNYKM
jgi:hypothetical protein